MPTELFKKGNKLATGRPKGSKNKSTTDLRQAYLNAFDNMQATDSEGRKQTGQEAFQLWAQANPSDFYKICGKLIKTSIDLTIDHKHEDFVHGLIEEEMIKEAEMKLIDVDSTKEIESNTLNKDSHKATDSMQANNSTDRQGDMIVDNAESTDSATPQCRDKSNVSGELIKPTLDGNMCA